MLARDDRDLFFQDGCRRGPGVGQPAVRASQPMRQRPRPERSWSPTRAMAATQLHELCRYITRPPVSHERLERLADGRLELRLKHPWKDGTRALLLEADDLIVRLVAAVPPPYFICFAILASSRDLPAEHVATIEP